MKILNKRNTKKSICITLISSFLFTTMLPAKASSQASTNIDYELIADLISERTYLDEELETIGLSVDEIFTLPTMDEQFYTEVATLTQDVMDAPITTYTYEPTVQTLEAQRLAYAGKMAKWSKANNPIVNEQSEVIYMYLSHYVDVPSPLAASNGISNNSTGLFSQYIKKRDRDTYELYLSRGTGIQAARNVKNLLSLSLTVPGEIKDTQKWFKEKREFVKGTGLAGELGLDISASKNAFDAIKKSMEAGKSPELVIESVRETLQPKFGETSIALAESFTGIVFSIAAGNLSVKGMIISAAGIAFDLTMNLYDTLNFIGMRIDFSARFSGRFDYFMTGKP